MKITDKYSGCCALRKYNMSFKKDKKGIWFLSAWMLAGIFGIIAIISVALLLFNQNIKEAVALVTAFLDGIKIYVFIGVVLFIAWKTKILEWAFNFVKGILKI